MTDPKPFSVKINHPYGEEEPSLGWIYLTFETGDSKITLHVSDVNDPLFDPALVFLRFMDNADSGPIHIEIDEEIEIKEIRILPLADQQVQFEVADYDYRNSEYYDPTEVEEDPEYPHTYIDIEINRDILITTFFSSFIDFLENGFQPERWREDDIRPFYLPAVKERFLSYLNDKQQPL
ncbi:MAG: hypothetical protein DRQ52_11225 [Gammaproteobacteria bacterium]|nr:MAG: hypothetical protein DRQ52_11225 [Gammaproteobacteria bacterium]